jgi:hypothetical protein
LLAHPGAHLGQPQRRAGDGLRRRRPRPQPGRPGGVHGHLEERPALGAGAPARAADIDKALALVHNSTWLWLLGTALASVLAHA